MWTGRLEVMLTGLEGCMCGEGTPPVRGSPPRSDILEAARRKHGLSRGARGRNTRSSLSSPCECVLSLSQRLLLLLRLPLAYFFFRLLLLQTRKNTAGGKLIRSAATRRPVVDTSQSP